MSTDPISAVTSTLCSTVHPETSVFVLAFATAHAEPKSGMRHTPGRGGELGDVKGKASGMGQAVTLATQDP